MLASAQQRHEPLRAGWLRDMVEHALRPEVGAVGAKLLYPSGKVQHAGVVLGIGGVAGHAHKHFARRRGRVLPRPPI